MWKILTLMGIAIVVATTFARMLERELEKRTSPPAVKVGSNTKQVKEQDKPMWKCGGWNGAMYPTEESMREAFR